MLYFPLRLASPNSPRMSELGSVLQKWPWATPPSQKISHTLSLSLTFPTGQSSQKFGYFFLGYKKTNSIKKWLSATVMWFVASRLQSCNLFRQLAAALYSWQILHLCAATTQQGAFTNYALWIKRLPLSLPSFFEKFFSQSMEINTAG